MCMCGCEYENGCGDCTINYNYCEYERLDRIKDIKDDIRMIESAIVNAEQEEEDEVVAYLKTELSAAEEELRELEESEED